MSFSNKLVKAVLEPNTGEVFLFLVTFTHPSLSEPVRLVNNLEDIVSRGFTYKAFPLELSLPPDDGDTLPSIRLVCQNASLELIEILRSVNGLLDVTIELILASTPGYIEAEISNMRVSSIDYNKDTITLNCTVDDFLNTSFPKERYLPNNFPGLFK